MKKILVIIGIVILLLGCRNKIEEAKEIFDKGSKSWESEGYSKKTMSYYKKSAEMGYWKAQITLAERYVNKEIYSSNQENKKKLYKKIICWYGKATNNKKTPKDYKRKANIELNYYKKKKGEIDGEK